MTTIAFRNGVMAADSLLGEGGTIIGQVTKIRKIGRYLVGGTGSWEKCCAFMDYIERKIKNPAIAKLDLKGNGFTGIVCSKTRNGKGYEIQTFEDMLFPMPMKAEYYALGSGQDYALGAMAYGASAVNAVKAAMRHDKNTGGKIIQLKL